MATAAVGGGGDEWRGSGRGRGRGPRGGAHPIRPHAVQALDGGNVDEWLAQCNLDTPYVLSELKKNDTRARSDFLAAVVRMTVRLHSAARATVWTQAASSSSAAASGRGAHAIVPSHSSEALAHSLLTQWSAALIQHDLLHPFAETCCGRGEFLDEFHGLLLVLQFCFTAENAPLSDNRELLTRARHFILDFNDVLQYTVCVAAAAGVGHDETRRQILALASSLQTEMSALYQKGAVALQQARQAEETHDDLAYTRQSVLPSSGAAT
jgi:hypothetical protein